MPIRPLLAAGLVAVLGPAPLLAQPAVADAPPFTLTVVEGRVDVARENRVEPADAPDAIDIDDRLIATAGRAELVDDDGTLLHLATGADLRIESGMRPRLVRGRLMVHTSPTASDVTIAVPAGVVSLEPRGAYELAADDLDGDTVIAVVEGRATMTSGDREWPLDADDALRLDPRDPRPRWSRTARADEMRTWANRRADRATLTRATATLPPATQAWAGDLAQAGRWDTLAPYGAVWYPTVSSGWRPYSEGRWRLTRRGWTWIDRTRWGWPVHHYGRWGFQASRGWYWMPQRTWGPAWVSWAVGADHVGWAPLGWDAQPVAPFPLGGRGRDDRWASTWSFAGRPAFGARGRGRVALTDPRTLPGPVLGGFVSQPIGPRAPAGPGDRFLARPGQWSTPPIWSRGPAPVRRPEPPPARVMDAPRPWGQVDGAARRRPGDAPGARPPDAPLGPVARPGDREWSPEPRAEMSHPDPAPAELRRAPMPVGPPVRPSERGIAPPPEPPSGTGSAAGASSAPRRPRGGAAAPAAPRTPPPPSAPLPRRRG